MEHMLRATCLGLRIVDLVGGGQQLRERVYYANLLAWIGCHADSPELAALFGDDIGFRSDYYLIDARGLSMLSMMVRHIAADQQGARRTMAQARFIATARPELRELISSHCTSAGRLAARIGLDEELPVILANTFERWDGKGLPAGKSGAEIPLEMRIAQLADTVEVYLRSSGLAGSLSMVKKRSGTQFDPALAELFCARATQLVDGLLAADPWDNVLNSVLRDAMLTAPELDAVLEAMGDFADLKSPWTTAHSRAVADLAGSAAASYGLGISETRVLRRAGWVHDLGRMGVSNSIWDAPGELSGVQREHLAMYPLLSERILGRLPGMLRVAQVAGAHRERLDGSGYPLGRTAPALDPCQRLFAAVDAYQTYLEPRPHRVALEARAAGARLRAEGAAGRLEARSIEAVLAAVEGSGKLRGAGAGGLTAREIEVLRLLCRGIDHHGIATALVISPKTARNHIEHIYLKSGATNRVSVTLFALENGLWDRGTPVNPSAAARTAEIV
ncbi:LuxR family transcriptional regulator [Arthrobacter sp. MYb227]|nr:LuxR family transcriptional regulator [Arthrobacter sp. MYb227]